MKARRMTVGTFIRHFYWAILLCLAAANPARALTAQELLIVYNRDLPASKEVAEYYAEKRQIPRDRLVGLRLPSGESISRTDYEEKLALPLAARIRQEKQSASPPALLLVYGVPLKVGAVAKNAASELPALAKRKVADLAPQVAELTQCLKGGAAKPSQPEAEAPSLPPVAEIIKEATGTLATLAERQGKESAPTSPRGKELALLLLRLTGITPIARDLGGRRPGDLGPNPAELKADSLLAWSILLEEQLLTGQFRGVVATNAVETASQLRLGWGLLGELRFWHDLAENDPAQDSLAGVDSELSLLLAEPYGKRRWLPNPFQPRFDTLPTIATIRKNTVMVARLDGPTPAIAKRLVDDALRVEEGGLEGIFYIDARGLVVKKADDAYAIYDEHLRRLRDLLAARSKMEVVFDNDPALFPPGSAPKAALYCGWYSLGAYIDAFAWQPGAVGFHVASAEATTLHNAESKVWAKRMLELGIGATLGPVAEPYLESFPLPDLFFPLLMGGKMPLLEVYYRSTPFLSWRQVLIGDPLYNPFRHHPALDEEEPPRSQAERVSD